MTTQTTYPKSMMFFHLVWLLLVLGAYIAINMTELFPRTSIAHNLVLQTHFFVGLLVLIFVVPRFIIRVKKYKDVPPITPELTKTNKILANAGHIALYIWMVVTPLLGWALASASYWEVNIYGLHIPWIIAQSRDSAKLLRELHEVCAWIGVVLISGHIFMALLHHFKMKDNTMIRMFPWFKWRMKK